MDNAENVTFAVETISEGNETGGEIDVGDLFNDEKAKADAPKPERTFTQADVNRAVQERLRAERKKAAYALGTEMLNERMERDGLSEKDALKAIRDERLQRKVAEYKENPEKGFEELLRSKESVDTPNTQDRAETIAAELMQEQESGKIPSDFDLGGYLQDRERAKEFLRYREALGVEEAVKIARLQMATDSEAKKGINRSLPKPIGTQNSYKPTSVDFTAMSSEEFRKARAQIQAAHAKGKRVKL